MKTLAVHAHLLSLADESGTACPDLWRHDLGDGSLTYSFAGSPNRFTWDAAAIAEMPQPPAALTSSARQLLDRWQAVRTMLDHGSFADPDEVLVDHAADEMTLFWSDPKLAVIFGGSTGQAS